VLASEGDYDVYAGAGLGALNAGLAACDAGDSIDEFWERARSLLLGPGNWSLPRGASLLSGRAMRRFLAAHLSERRLAATGRRLAVVALDLQTGRQHLSVFPGSDLPLIDALAAATASPGLIPPVIHGGHQLVEDMVVASFPLRALRGLDIDEILALVALDGMSPTPRPPVNWRVAMELGTQMHLKSDVFDALGDAETLFATSEAFSLVADLAPHVRDGAGETAATAFGATVREARADVAHILRGGSARVRAVVPSRDLGYPPWRFRPSDLLAARRLGLEDARHELAGAS
jgi:predicted acylesterase/phospholipase RssA